MDKPRAQTGPSGSRPIDPGLRRTVPQQAFSSEGLRAHLESDALRAEQDSTGPDAGAFPRLERQCLADLIRQSGDSAPGTSTPRFEVERVLGVGATGCVYAVRDRNLKRAVAVKFLAEDGALGDPAAIEHFVQEAQITAELEHPNVLPVHELDVNDAGQVYFSMKKIDGRSLGALIEQSAPERRVPPLDDANALVNLVIDVCQALAYAHAHGIVHQDVKPDNIMVGGFGEVLLVDWGSAVRIGTGSPRLYGTPLYMSPEQARAEHVDERSDVYCVGATLFHALMLRPPTWSDDPDEFWRLKRSGVIQPPTREELTQAMRPLVHIALKALAPEAKDRYADAAALLADLRSYQAGLAVSAYRDMWFESLARWHHRHWRWLWSSVAVAGVVLALGAALYGEKIKEMATWGSPKVDERFADDSWRTGWTVLAGRFERRDGRLISTDPSESLLLWSTKLWGPVAIEYDAEILAGSQPGDISAFWARDFTPGGKPPLHGRYGFQVGAFDGAYTAIRDAAGRHLGSDQFRPEPGHRYRIRAEVDDYRLTLSVDGRVICQWTDTVRFDGGYLGLYAFYPGKAFANVRIFRRGLAQKVPATAIGDALMRLSDSAEPQMRLGIYDQAYEQYARVVDSQPGTAVEREARYKEGLCRWEQARYVDAFTAWAPLSGTAYQPQIDLYRIDAGFTRGDHDGALAELEALYASADAELRKGVAMRWGHYVDLLRTMKDRSAVERYLACHDRVFPHEEVVDVNAADALLFLHRYHELLERYPQQRRHCADALIALGREHDLIALYPDQRIEAFKAMFDTGEFAMLERKDPENGFMNDVRVKTGRAEEALRHGAKGVDRWLALVALGREDEALAAGAELGDNFYANTLCLFGREDEAARVETTNLRLLARLMMREPATVLATAGEGTREFLDARLLLGIQAFMRGDVDEGRRWCDDGETDPRMFDEWIFRVLILPGLEHPHDPAAWAQAAAPALADRWSIEQMPWFMASWLAGAIGDDAFLEQPHRVHADARLELLRGLRADREGRAAEADAAYRAFITLPSWRRAFEPWPVTEAFVRSRIEGHQ